MTPIETVDKRLSDNQMNTGTNDSSIQNLSHMKKYADISIQETDSINTNAAVKMVKQTDNVSSINDKISNNSPVKS